MGSDEEDFTGFIEARKLGRPPTLFKLAENFYVYREEIAALEDYEHWYNDPSPSGSSHVDHTGCIVILKNGRKTYLKGKTAEGLAALISGREDNK